MNFLGMGPGELMLIAVLGLIVFGPGKLPEIAAQVGKAVRDFRRNTYDIQAEFQRSLSLDLDPNAKPVGPAAVFAQNGATTEQPAPPPVEPAAPLADTSDWHFETAGEPAAPPVAPSFWDWDNPEPEPAPAEAPARPADGAASSAVWQWEEVEAPAASDSKPGPTQGSA